MTRFINLMANDVWTEADLMNRMRAMVGAVSSPERQHDLQTIMIGHIAQMRAATASELAEIMAIKLATESAGEAVLQARLDMALLHDVRAFELAKLRLTLPVVEAVYSAAPVSIDPDAPPAEPTVTNQSAIDTDGVERLTAQVVVDAATPEALALSVLRYPPPVAVVVAQDAAMLSAPLGTKQA